MCNKTGEVKRFGGSLPGVRVYFDRLWLDDTGSIEAKHVRKTTVFIVLAQGVFLLVGRITVDRSRTK